MNTRRRQAWLVLGAALLMIPGRWAAAAEGEPVASVEASPPAGAAPTPPAAESWDRERPWGTAARPSFAPPPPDVAPPVATPAPLFVGDPLMIQGPLFYEVVGRPDLAAKYRMRHALGVTSAVVGGISLGLGALTWLTVQVFVAGFKAPFCGLDRTGDCKTDTGTLWGPDLMMAGGLALLVAPMAWSNDPVSPAERVELARAAMSRSRTEQRAFEWHVAAAPTNDGAAVSLSGRF